MKTEKYVITGPPKSGKHELLERVSKKIKIYTMKNVVKALLEGDVGKKINPETRPYEFQKEAFRWEKEWSADFNFAKPITEGTGRYLMVCHYLDRMAWLEYKGFKDSELYREIEEESKKHEYEKVFMCENTFKTFEKISEIIDKTYRRLGYKPIQVPNFFMIESNASGSEKAEIREQNIEKRVELILQYIK